LAFPHRVVPLIVLRLTIGTPTTYHTDSGKKFVVLLVGDGWGRGKYSHEFSILFHLEPGPSGPAPGDLETALEIVNSSPTA